MLEIVFTDGKIGAGAVKIIGVGEKVRIDAASLSKEENALLRKYAVQAGFEGKAGSFAEVFGASGKIIAVGLGEKPDALSLRQAGEALAAKLFKDAVVVFEPEPIKGCKLTTEDIACNLAFGLQLGTYRFDKYFTRKKPDEYPNLERVVFKVKNPTEANECFKHLAALANAVRYAKDLCNEPANYLTPEVFAADIKRLEYLGLDIEIMGRKELLAKDFGLLLAVAKGSAQEPKVAVIKWKGNPKSAKWDLGLVGKGITFDSGGVQLKTKSGMQEMHMDMMGAAVVVASLKALALQCCPKNIIGIVGLAENMLGPDAMKTGDVYTSMSGQTVEVSNTDGEGRMILADLMWYLQKEYDVAKLVDIATMGSFRSVLGTGYAGMFCNDDMLEKTLIKAGQAVSEKLWPFPLDAVYDKLLNSVVADMVNVGLGVLGHSMCSGAFLKRFVQPGCKWAHLDVFGVHLDGKGLSSGFGVQLLNEYINTGV